MLQFDVNKMYNPLIYKGFVIHMAQILHLGKSLQMFFTFLIFSSSPSAWSKPHESANRNKVPEVVGMLKREKP